MTQEQDAVYGPNDTTKASKGKENQNGKGNSRLSQKNNKQKPRSVTPSFLLKPVLTLLKSSRPTTSSWSRRLAQKAIIALHIFGMVISFTIFGLLFLVPYLPPFLVLYVIGVLFSDTGCSGSLSRRSQRFRHAKVWKIFASYFPAQLHRSVELPPTGKYVFGYHPHGILCHGAFLAFGTEALGFSQLFPGITNTLLTLDSNFRLPLYREYILSLGLGGVSRSSCKKFLSQGGFDGKGMGRAITVVIGGARESLLATPETMRLILRSRKGFITLAIQQGANLVPVLGFGENALYEQRETTETHPRVLKLQLLLKQAFGWTLPLFYGRNFWGKGPGLLPYQRPLNVVVGRPVEVVQQDTPAEEYVDVIHKRYMDEIARIWDEWKDVYAGGREVQLEFL